MIREYVASWRQKMLLNRIVSARDRNSGVRRRWSRDAVKRTAVLACITAVGGYAAADAQQRPVSTQNGACVIKGNINDRGERIYHVPGGALYERTRVTPAKGERWFCSESDARAAGWRRSKR